MHRLRHPGALRECAFAASREGSGHPKRHPNETRLWVRLGAAGGRAHGVTQAGEDQQAILAPPAQADTVVQPVREVDQGGGCGVESRNRAEFRLPRRGRFYRLERREPGGAVGVAHLLERGILSLGSR